MKKINNKGFILAETLVVSVFLMVIFAMIYANFYPVIGEYEKRENYDDVDGKYAAYWIKRMIESDAYNITSQSSPIDPSIPNNIENIKMLNRLGYFRFDCSDLSNESQRNMCQDFVKELGVARCNSYGDGCDIYVTRFTLDYGDDASMPPSLKQQVRRVNPVERFNEVNALWGRNPFSVTNAQKIEEANYGMNECCKYEYWSRGYGPYSGGINCRVNSISQTNPGTNPNSLYTNAHTANRQEVAQYCQERMLRKAFLSPTKDYILSLPNYSIEHKATGAKYRVIVVLYHTKHIQHTGSSEKGYYSFSTMEVVR